MNCYFAKGFEQGGVYTKKMNKDKRRKVTKLELR